MAFARFQVPLISAADSSGVTHARVIASANVGCSCPSDLLHARRLGCWMQGDLDSTIL